jgi:F-type H+-transporting ATPase subunit delta
LATQLHARRYAQAVFELAQQHKNVERWQSDLEKIASLGRNAELMDAVQNPKSDYASKTRLVGGHLKDISPLATNLVNLLISKGRFDLVLDIAGEFQMMVDDLRGTAKAQVTTAVPLDPEEKLAIANRLEEISGKQIVLTASVDPGIIGGIIARIGGKLIDGSTRSQLIALKSELAESDR